MPYSKNPHRYPPELLALLEALQSGKYEEIELPCESAKDATGKRIMVQSFFAAVEAHAEDLAAVAARIRTKAVSHAAKPNASALSLREEYEEAMKVAGLWEQRAVAVAGWKVSAQKEPPALRIGKRTLKGTFAQSLGGFLTGQPAIPATPALPASELEEQLALLRRASATEVLPSENT